MDTIVASATVIEDRVLAQAVRDRITDLLHDRAWYRRQVNRAHWSPLRLETEAELRSLVRLAQSARGRHRGLSESESRALWGDR